MGDPDAGEADDGGGSGRHEDDRERGREESRDVDRDRYGEGFVPDDGGNVASADGEDGGEDGDDESLREELEDLRAEVAEFEEEIEDRTVHREAVEDDLRSYVRRRLRRGHARGWGPYLVLLYGTAMTIGAFVELEGVWAILAMIVIWLSTLGLYTLMVLFGVGIAALYAPGRAMRAVEGFINTLRDLRS